MSTFDLSRYYPHTHKHYTGARLQQGRVLLDSDFNEEAELDDREAQSSLLELVGPAGSPDAGFSLALTPGQPVPRVNLRLGSLAPRWLVNFGIRPGALYLGGLRFVAEAQEAFAFQSEHLQLRQGPDGTKPFMAYLRAWEQAVSAVEDEEILDPALSGIDTSVRMRRMRRVEAVDVGSADCARAWNEVLTGLQGAHSEWVSETAELRSRARMHVVPVEDEDAAGCDACAPNAAGGYLGAENQAIRIMLADQDHYVWAYDNASPLYRVSWSSGDEVEFLTLPRDEVHWPLQDTIVELLPWSARLPNGSPVAAQTGIFARVTTSYDPARRVVRIVPLRARSEHNETWFGPDGKVAFSANFWFLRVWQRMGEGEAALLPTNSDRPMRGTGLRPVFEGVGRPGDYWIVTARPEAPDQILPSELRTPAPPHGPRVYVTPLAVIDVQTGVEGGPRIKSVHDCRPRFRPLTEWQTCCRYTVGDGVRSRGDYTRIQDALDALPVEGGKVCILPGVYRESVRVVDRLNVVIEGCGVETRLEPAGDDVIEPLIRIDGSAHVTVRELALLPRGQVAVRIGEDELSNERLPPRHITLEKLHVFSRAHVPAGRGARSGFDVRNALQVAIRDCDVLLDGAEVSDDAAIFVQGFGIRVEHNRACVLDCLRELVIGMFPGAEPGEDVPPVVLIARHRAELLTRLNALTFDKKRVKRQVRAFGGIQIGASSSRVHVRSNVIEGGLGHGITLGSVRWSAVGTKRAPIYRGAGFGIFLRLNCDDWTGWPTPIPFPEDPDGETYVPEIAGELLGIHLADNDISLMAGSGISVLSVLLPADWTKERYQALDTFSVQDLTIEGNRIRHNARGTLGPGSLRTLDLSGDDVEEIGQVALPDFVFGGIVLGEVERGIVRGNVIEDNGASNRPALCGVFALLADELVIESNRIRNNGRKLVADDATTKGFDTAFRGGIVVVMAGEALELEDEPNFADASLHVHGNLIEQPEGRALCAYGMGPMSFHDNFLGSRGVGGALPLTLGHAVEIVNVGWAWEMSFSMRQPAASPFIQVLGSGGGTSFQQNQVRLTVHDLEGTPTLASSVCVISLDSLTFHGNQVWTAMPGPDVKIRMISNVLLLALLVLAQGNRMTEGQNDTGFSLYSLALAANNTTNNVATHCIFVSGEPWVGTGNIELMNAEACGAYEKEKRPVLQKNAIALFRSMVLGGAK